MESVLDWLEGDGLVGSQFLRDLLLSLFVVLFLMVGRWLILRAVNAQTEDVRLRYKWSKGSTYAAVAIGLPLILMIWIAEVGSIGTFLGLVSVLSISASVRKTLRTIRLIRMRG